MSRFRVLQLNMQYGQRWDAAAPDTAPIDLDATIAEIRRLDADIVQLQEVEHAQPGGAQEYPPPNYTRLLAGLPSYHGHFSYPRADPRELPFGLGLATLSRQPLSDAWVEHLPSPPVEFDFFGERKTPTDRVLIGVTTRAGGRDLRLLNTHLLAFFMLKTDSRTHPGQRRRLAEHLRAAHAAGHATILSGDFNIRDHAGLAAEYAAEGFSTAQTERITWLRQSWILDHIFYNSPLRLVRWEVVESTVSDHLPLVADFEWA